MITRSAKRTQQIAQKLARQVSAPAIITLTGNLGSGKTTFVQGLAMGLGIEKQVNSPTFLIIKKYELATRNFYHADLYRLSSKQEVVATGLLDILREKDSIVVIEWAEKMGSLLPAKRIDVQFAYINEHERKIEITYT